MITIQSGKLIIPEEDRFVGFAGDNLVNMKRIVLPDHEAGSGSYTLCLRFDDDSVRVIPLEKSVSGSDLVLTWNIRKSHLLKPGIVMAQVKSVDSDDVVLHTSCDYFIIAGSAELSEDGDPEYVAREELEERLSEFCEKIRSSAPYIGDDGYWYVFDIESDTYVRSITAGVTVDSEMADGSSNPVQNGVIKEFVENALDAKVDKTTRIAAMPLDNNIRASDLAANIGSYINPSTVQPGITTGYLGQFGRTFDGKPVMCENTSSWKQLATASELSPKMDLAPTINNHDIDGLPAGQVFLAQGGVCIKIDSGYFELAKKNSVYSKTEIDSMIGDLEELLSAI